LLPSVLRAILSILSRLIHAILDFGMKLSFVIVTYKRGNLLQKCLDSVFEQQDLSRPYEVIVVDNGGDAEVAVPGHADIIFHLEQPGKNLGAAGGRNLGMSLAQGD